MVKALLEILMKKLFITSKLSLWKVIPSGALFMFN